MYFSKLDHSTLLNFQPAFEKEALTFTEKGMDDLRRAIRAPEKLTQALDPSRIALLAAVDPRKLEDTPHLLVSLLHLFTIHQDTTGLRAVSEHIEASELDPHLKERMQQHIDFLVDAERYGHKAAHLIEMRKLFESKAVKVPEVYPIAVQEVQDHLAAHGFDLAEQWEAYAKCKQNPVEGKQKLKFIETEIARIFREHPFSHEAIDNALGKHPKGHLMVRSSGNEDTEDIDNAGANYSAINVAADAKDLSTEIGKVIASYFTEVSLGSDPDQMPLTSTFIQPMSGAEDDPERWTGAVVFHDEPVGFTREVTLIEAAPGATQLVVDELGPTDTFLVDREAHISKKVREKPVRMAPGETGTEKKGNEAVQSKNPALSQVQVRFLHQIASTLARHEGGPVDIEVQVDRKTSTFHLLQCRPIVRSEDAAEPSHIRAPKDFSGLAAKGKVIVPSRKNPLYGLKENEVLIASTPDEAFKRYKKGIGLVIVTDGGKASSHGATQLRRRRIPVVHVMDPLQVGNIKQLLKAGKVLHACPLSGGVYMGDRKQLEEVSGFGSHPLPAEVSLPEVHMREGALRGLFKSLPVGRTDRTVSELLDTLKQAVSEDEYKKALGEVLGGVVHKTGEDPTPDEKQVVFNIALAVKRCTDAYIHPCDSMERLYPINQLEAVLTQRGATDLRDAESLATVEAERRSRQRLIDAGYACPEDITGHEARASWWQLMKLQNLAIGEECREAWPRIVEEACRNPEDHALLNKTVYTVAEAEMALPWIQTIGLSDTVSTLAEGLTRNEPALRALRQKERDLQQIQSRLALWGDPANFDSLLESDFKKGCQIIQSIIDEYCAESEPGLDLSRQRAFQIVSDAIEIMDGCIKEFSAIPDEQFERVDNKVHNLGKLLHEYLEIPAGFVFHHDVLSVFPTITTQSFVTDIQRSLDVMTSWGPDASLLEPSGMDVEAARIRFPSCADSNPDVTIERYAQPQSLEDCFSITHWAAKDILGNWMETSCPTTAVRDEDLARMYPHYAAIVTETDQDLLNLQQLGTRIDFVTTVTAQGVTSRAGFMIGIHEASISMTMDPTDGCLQINVDMYGDDDAKDSSTLRNRWDGALSIAMLAKGPLKMKEVAPSRTVALQRKPEGGRKGTRLQVQWQGNLIKPPKGTTPEEYGRQIRSCLMCMVEATNNTCITKKSKAPTPDWWQLWNGTDIRETAQTLRGVFSGSSEEELIEHLSLEDTSNTPHFNDSIARYYFEKGEPERALQVCQQVIDCLGTSIECDVTYAVPAVFQMLREQVEGPNRELVGSFVRGLFSSDSLQIANPELLFGASTLLGLLEGDNPALPLLRKAFDQGGRQDAARFSQFLLENEAPRELARTFLNNIYLRGSEPFRSLHIANKYGLVAEEKPALELACGQAIQEIHTRGIQYIQGYDRLELCKTLCTLKPEADDIAAFLKTYVPRSRGGRQEFDLDFRVELAYTWSQEHGVEDLKRFCEAISQGRHSRNDLILALCNPTADDFMTLIQKALKSDRVDPKIINNCLRKIVRLDPELGNQVMDSLLIERSIAIRLLQHFTVLVLTRMTPELQKRYAQELLCLEGTQFPRGDLQLYKRVLRSTEKHELGHSLFNQAISAIEEGNLAGGDRLLRTLDKHLKGGMQEEYLGDFEKLCEAMEKALGDKTDRPEYKTLEEAKVQIRKLRRT